MVMVMVTSKVGGWRLVVGGGWRLAVGRRWRLAAVGGWGGRWSLGAGLNKKKRIRALKGQPWSQLVQRDGAAEARAAPVLGLDLRDLEAQLPPPVQHQEAVPDLPALAGGHLALHALDHAGPLQQPLLLRALRDAVVRVPHAGEEEVHEHEHHHDQVHGDDGGGEAGPHGVHVLELRLVEGVQERVHAGHEVVQQRVEPDLRGEDVQGRGEGAQEGGGHQEEGGEVGPQHLEGDDDEGAREPERHPEERQVEPAAEGGERQRDVLHQQVLELGEMR